MKVLIHSANMIGSFEKLTQFHQLRDESLLTAIRITTLLLLVIFIHLALTGRSRHKRWQTILYPIVLLLSSFIIYLISPNIGKYMIPILLNIGFALFINIKILIDGLLCKFIRHPVSVISRSKLLPFYQDN